MAQSGRKSRERRDEIELHVSGPLVDSTRSPMANTCYRQFNQALRTVPRNSARPLPPPLPLKLRATPRKRDLETALWSRPSQLPAWQRHLRAIHLEFPADLSIFAEEECGTRQDLNVSDADGIIFPPILKVWVTFDADADLQHNFCRMFRSFERDIFLKIESWDFFKYPILYGETEDAELTKSVSIHCCSLRRVT